VGENVGDNVVKYVGLCVDVVGANVVTLARIMGADEGALKCVGASDGWSLGISTGVSLVGAIEGESLGAKLVGIPVFALKMGCAVVGLEGVVDGLSLCFVAVGVFEGCSLARAFRVGLSEGTSLAFGKVGGMLGAMDGLSLIFCVVGTKVGIKEGVSLAAVDEGKIVGVREGVSLWNVGCGVAWLMFDGGFAPRAEFVLGEADGVSLAVDTSRSSVFEPVGKVSCSALSVKLEK
jgi:hypothetical protein